MGDLIYDLVLTRPLARSQAFVAGLPAHVCNRLAVHYAPVMRIDRAGKLPDLSHYAAVIISSASVLEFLQPHTGKTAFCVGKKTTQAAVKAGFAAHLMGETADDLVRAVIAQDPTHRLIHVHGRHTLGDIAERLNTAGIETDSVPIYDQIEVEIDPKIKATIETSEQLIVPLFSPRSAALFAAQVARLNTGATLLALSPQVADALPPDFQNHTIIAQSPTAQAVSDQITRIIAG